MKFSVEGQVYEFDETVLRVREARDIKRFTGMGLKQFGAGLQEGDVDALVGMIYLARRRNGEAVKWTDLDDINIASIDLSAAVSDAAALPDPPVGDAAEEAPTPAE